MAVQASDRKRPDLSPQTVMGALVVACPPMAAHFSTGRTYCRRGWCWGLGQGCASTQLKQWSLSICRTMGASWGGVSWHLALSQLQRPELAARVAPRFWQGLQGKEQGVTQVAGISDYEYLRSESWWHLQVVHCAALAVGFFGGEICWACVQSRSPWIIILLLCSCYL